MDLHAKVSSFKKEGEKTVFKAQASFIVSLI